MLRSPAPELRVHDRQAEHVRSRDGVGKRAQVMAMQCIHLFGREQRGQAARKASTVARHELEQVRTHAGGLELVAQGPVTDRSDHHALDAVLRGVRHQPVHRGFELALGKVLDQVCNA